MKQTGHISEKNYDHLATENCTEARFYVLPQIKVYQQTNMQFRNHPNNRISKLVDGNIKDYVPKRNPASRTPRTT